MRVLVLGGTVFVGHAVATEALRRGHEVVCAARGESGPVPDGATLVRVDRDAEDGLAPLAGESFDAVVDVATVSYPWVDRALRALADRVGHWTFVSTINVYADSVTPGQRADAALVEPVQRHATREETQTEAGVGLYGGIKVASENAVRAAMGDHAFVVRPGLITGPGDTHDRFGYWPARFSRGGRVLVPDVPEQPMQYIDVRDLAGWILDAAERDLSGDFDAIGPAGPLPELLRGIAEVVGVDVEFVPATPEQLVAAKVNPWAGPRSLPFWLPPSHAALAARDAGPSLAAGMPVLALADAVSGALEHERALGLDRERNAGLTREEEADILAGL
ncbi:MAG TPA: NAD-dependent epimerase/dehydratase family protein [Actinophytocola sp.]|uniref:NAD-dependent epimerase/dehydratase family protein n=1 Tax=Actinophytocola sp. TaxID=1872138 RepID=UPI002DB99FE9|nr:NAD-dependent epimerase/dehydratase family protein [Actinophytocola sp.]HEU5474068.1 NAD-dependent epimerase/dehydratase family protein [Actinophytocola sp.]